MKAIAPSLFAGLGASLLCMNVAAAQFADFEQTGSGNLRWLGLKIYSASLWRGKSDSGSPQLLLLEYARSASRERLYASTREEWVRLHGEPHPVAATWLAELERIYPDVEKGSRLACLVEPDGPTRFYLDGQLIGTIAAAEFGPDFLAIWLDPATSRPGLRRRLLGLD